MNCKFHDHRNLRSLLSITKNLRKTDATFDQNFISIFKVCQSLCNELIDWKEFKSFQNLCSFILDSVWKTMFHEKSFIM